jgi:hypothetical protein
VDLRLDQARVALGERAWRHGISGSGERQELHLVVTVNITARPTRQETSSFATLICCRSVTGFSFQLVEKPAENIAA